MSRTISDQHFEFLQRQAERAAFMWSVLDARKGITHSAEVREFTEYLLAAVGRSLSAGSVEVSQ